MHPARSGVASSAHPIPAAAVGEAVGRVLETLGTAPDLALVTVTPPLAGAFADVVDAVRRLLEPGTLLGAVVGAPTGSSVAIWATRIGPARPFALRVADAATATLTGIPEVTGVDGGVLVITREVATGRLLAADSPLAAAQTGVPLVGGSLSGSDGGAWHRTLAVDGRLVDADAIGVVLGPRVDVEVLHSTGTRPVGPVLTVTGSSGLLLDGLDGIGARDALDRVVAACDPEERAAFRQGIHLAIESPAGTGVPDDRVADVLGVDRARSALALTQRVQPGDAVRFHVPDPTATDADHELALVEQAQGADASLLVTSPVRSAARRPDHEARWTEELLGAPVGVLAGATPIVSSWGRSHLLPSPGVAVLTLRSRP